MTTVPIPPELAENSPIYAEICGLNPPSGGTPLPCPRPGKPVVEPGSERAQGFVFTVPLEHPEGDNIHKIWIEALDATASRIWERKSVQGIPPGGLPSSPGSTMRIGVPGLNVNSAHYVRVAFENGSGLKTCYSVLSDPIYTTPFTSGLPALPTNIFTRMEDDFDRPATDPVHGTQIGDGVGPEDIWFPSDAFDTSYPVSVAEDETSADMPQGSSIVFERFEETGQESLTEAEIRVELDSGGGGDSYNFEVEARIGPLLTKAFAVKLAHVLRGCENPTLLIYRRPDEDNPGCNASHQPSPGGAVCTADPPLDIEDPNKPGFSYPVRLRIHVYLDLEGDPVVEGQAYWKNTSTGAYETCVAGGAQRFFSGDPGLMAGERGRWGIVVHERDYRTESIRAGDSGSPAP